MMFDAEDRQTMLEAVGIAATLESGESILIMEPQYQGPQVVYGGGGMDTVNPRCLADAAEIEEAGLTFGEDGSLLSIGLITYRCLSSEPDASGFTSIELGAT